MVGIVLEGILYCLCGSSRRLAHLAELDESCIITVAQFKVHPRARAMLTLIAA